jgi:hypothetical protein
MPGPYGVTPEGFNRKTLQEIKDELEQDQRSDISPKLNTSPTSPHGQLNATFSRQLALAWEALEACHDQIDPDKAEGEGLAGLGKLTGTNRPVATFSEVTVTVNLTIGTVLTPDAQFAAVDGEPDNRWTPKLEYTATATGNVDLKFRSEFRGTKVANAGTLTVIATPLSGWNSVTNADDAVPGREVAEDPEYRQVREADINRAGSTTTLAIATDLRNLVVDGAKPIIAAKVIENDTDIAGVNGLPPHTLEPVIHDSPDVANDVIAQAIWDSKAGGIPTTGSTFGVAVIDDNGQTKQVAFSRVIIRDIYLEYDLTTTTGYVGDTAFKAEAVARLRGDHDLGDDVLRWVCEQAAKQEGVVNASVKLGFSASPTLSADLAIGDREIADFSTARITIV